MNARNISACRIQSRPNGVARVVLGGKNENAAERCAPFVAGPRATGRDRRRECCGDL